MNAPSTSRPAAMFPEFYHNPHIRSALASERLWTVSDFDKRPVDIVAALASTAVCPRCNQPECNEVHGARLGDASTQLMTLDQLTQALPDARNVATHIDWRSSGLMVLDIEPECPSEVVDQLLRLITGNAASEPQALYSEVSGSGRGFHLLLPVPANIALFPRVAHATKLQHPQRWYEVLLYHWITFSRNPIPAQRLVDAQTHPAGERVTWEGVFGQLAEMAPCGEAAGNGATGQFDGALAAVDRCPDLTGVTAELVDAVIHSLDGEPAKDLTDDFHGDMSRWEMSRLIRIAAISQSKLHIRQSIIRITGTAPLSADQYRQQLLTIVHQVARERIPYRPKHDEPRSGTTYLLKRCAEALEHLDA